jgi:fibronectin-binding autotransporter adhesin
LDGGTINITDPTNSFVMQTLSGGNRAQMVRSVVSGTDITVMAANGGGSNSFFSLGAPGTGATNTFTGDLIFGGPSNATLGLSQININNPTALPPTATVRMRRNLSQLLFGGGSTGVTGAVAYTATFNNNIILNDNASGTLTSAIGAAEAATEVTLGGVISGNANLIFQLGNGGGFGKIILANHSTYTGNTTLASQTGFVLQLGIDDALPVGTTFTVNRGFAFDMAGFDQRVGALNTTAANSADITNTGGTQSTLTIDGSANGSYLGNIKTDIALVLATTNTGRLTLRRLVGNEYTGGTTIGGGTLIAASNPAGSSTGTGPVAVNNGGTLGGGGGVGAAGTGTVSVASGGHIAPSGVFNNGTSVTTDTIGTLTALGDVSLGSGSLLDMELGAPAPAGGASDRLNLSAGTLTVPGAAASIGVNLSDPAGGAAGNGTYTLLSFPVGQYSGTNASQFFASSLPSPNSLNGATITYQLADDSNVNQNGNPSAATRVNMVVSGGPNALVWTGGVDGNWAAGSPGSPFNFSNLGTASGTTFAGNDNVTFDDTGANTTITVAGGGVQPNIVTINNSTNTYTFSGGNINGSSVGGGGALFLAGTGPVTIDSSYTAAGPIASNKSGSGSATFNGAITAATTLTVNGGAVTLAGANTYSGDNTVNGGSLTASGASATFGGGDVTVSGGNLEISSGVANAIADTATMSLMGGGTAGMPDIGYAMLGAGINETIATLILAGNTLGSGTFGSSSSLAANPGLVGLGLNPDEFFAGTGIITVPPMSLPGDYNNDGKVNAADYVLWRKDPNSFGGPGGYGIWRQNFGNPPGSGATLGNGAGVPEPGSLLFVALASLSLARFRPRRQHSPMLVVLLHGIKCR